MPVGRRARQGKDRTGSAVAVAVDVAPWHEGQEQQPHTTGPYYLVFSKGAEFLAKYIFHDMTFNFIFEGTA